MMAISSATARSPSLRTRLSVKIIVAAVCSFGKCQAQTNRMNRTVYRVVTSGTCAEAEYERIEDKATCEAAAKQVEWDDLPQFPVPKAQCTVSLMSQHVASDAQDFFFFLIQSEYGDLYKVSR